MEDNEDWGFYVDIETNKLLTVNHIPFISYKIVAEIEDPPKKQDQRKLFEMYLTVVGCIYIAMLFIF